MNLDKGGIIGLPKISIDVASQIIGSGSLVRQMPIFKFVRHAKRGQRQTPKFSRKRTIQYQPIQSN